MNLFENLTATIREAIKIKKTLNWSMDQQVYETTLKLADSMAFKANDVCHAAFISEQLNDTEFEVIQSMLNKYLIK